MRPHTPILELLTTQARLATSLQLKEFLKLLQQVATRILRAMKTQGWLESAHGAFRQPVMVSPILTWQPTQAPPNFHSLAHRLDSRWASTEPTPCHLWWATSLVVEEFGGVGGAIKQNLQIEHDLAVSEVFLQRGRCANWRMEDLFDDGEFGPTIPDAIVSDNSGAITVIEIGGQYSASRLEGFHLAVEQLELPYELW